MSLPQILLSLSDLWDARRKVITKARLRGRQGRVEEGPSVPTPPLKYILLEKLILRFFKKKVFDTDV